MMSSESPPEDRFNPCYIPAGTLIGKYEILTGIGRGGGQMAYLARDPNWNQVVVKVGLFPRDETGTWNRMRLERNRRQAQYFLQLSDVPAVARIYEYGMHPDNSEHGYPYLAEARLTRRCRSGRFQGRRWPHATQGWARWPSTATAGPPCET